MSESKINPEEQKVSASPYIRQTPTERVIVQQGTLDGFGMWALGEKGPLTIDGKGEMPGGSYDEPHAPWKIFEKSIQSAHLESGITSIGDRAFEDCSSLTRGVLPERYKLAKYIPRYFESYFGISRNIISFI